MAEQKSPGVKVKPPTPLLLKPLKVKDWPGLFQSLAKLGSNVAKMEFQAAFSDAVKALSYVEFKNKPQELAWTLIHRSMTRAVGEALAGLARHQPAEFARLGGLADSRRLDAELETLDVTLDDAFFDRPGWCPYVRQVCRRVPGWLVAAGLPQMAADELAGQIPVEFTVRLNEEWLKNQDDLKCLLPESRKTPFSPAVTEEFEWVRYWGCLQDQADRRVFDEDFGVRSVYVPLRAYTDRDGGAKVTRTIGMVEDMLDHWLEAGRADDDVRVVEGDPGAGKSTLARIYAADRFGRTFGGRRWRVVFAPLHHHAFQEERPLDQSVAAYYESVGVTLKKPLDRDSPDPTLLILDGLDELSRSGHVGLDVIRAFMSSVVGLKDGWNTGRKDARLLVLVCGRPIAADVARKVVRRLDAVLNLLPFVTEEMDLLHTTEGKEAVLAGRTALLKTDQRANWWDNYATARGQTPTPDAYKEIKKNAGLTPITAQPLLNYLVAFLRENSEGAKLPDNLCDIYDLLLRRVWERGWDRPQVPAVGKLEFPEFCTLLEEVAVAAWHSGDSRNIKVSAVQDRLTPKQRERLLELEKKVEDGVLRLLLGFFLRPRGQVRGDEVYEFTHKSFAEYLIARRIAGLLNELAEDWKNPSPRHPWNDEQALIEWAKLLGPTRIDKDIMRFVQEEGSRLGKDKGEGWQAVLARLLETVIRDGMPMHQMLAKIKPEPTYREMDRWALNAEVAMLRGLGVCRNLLGNATRINGLNAQLGEWIGGRWSHSMARSSYAFLDLQNAQLDSYGLHGMNLRGVDLRGANLFDADLSGADLCEANLSDATLTMVRLWGTDLSGAILRGAYLAGAGAEGAMLRGADLSGADLREAQFSSAYLRHADLSGAILLGVNLVGANLHGANLNGANLDGANLDGATGTQPEQLRVTIGEPDLMPDGKPPRKNWRNKPAIPRKRSPRKPKNAPPTPEPPATDTPS
jgi:uncharacterized protein YjbI with pentapeptide repeats